MADETPADGVEQQPEPDGDVQALVGNWKFIDNPPTGESVRDLLLRLADTYDVPYVDFIEYIQPISGTEKIKVPHPNRPGVKIDRKADVWTMYMSVAGRVKMLERIAHERGWRVDYEPEPVTPTGIPGMLQWDDKRIVYREYVTIYAPVGPMRVIPNGEGGLQGEQAFHEWVPIGRKPGTAWVPSTGGKHAAGTNPYEKVETAARGRAIAAWGIGVLPGSGVASLEEMQGAADPARQNTPPSEEVGQRSPEELLSQARMLLTQVRQARGLTPEQAEEIAGQRLTAMGVVSPYDAEAGEVDWKKPNTGQLTLLIEDLKAALRATEGEQLMEQGL